MAKTRYAPDKGLTARMGLTMFLLGLVFVAFVTALVFVLAAFRMGGGGILYELADDLFVAVLEDVEGAPGGVGRGDRMGLHPAAVGVLEETLRRARMRVAPARVQHVTVRCRTRSERRARQTEEDSEQREMMESHRSPSVVCASRRSAGSSGMLAHRQVPRSRDARDSAALSPVEESAASSARRAPSSVAVCGGQQ